MSASSWEKPRCEPTATILREYPTILREYHAHVWFVSSQRRSRARRHLFLENQLRARHLIEYVCNTELCQRVLSNAQQQCCFSSLSACNKHRLLETKALPDGGRLLPSIPPVFGLLVDLVRVFPHIRWKIEESKASEKKDLPLTNLTPCHMPHLPPNTCGRNPSCRSATLRTVFPLSPPASGM